MPSRAGSKNKKTIAKEELRASYNQQLAKELGSISRAQLKKALGVSHLMAKDSKTGQFIRVTDPATMQKVLNSGEQFYELHAQDPDTRAIDSILDRLMGKPVEAVELSGPDGEPVVIKWQE